MQFKKKSLILLSLLIFIISTIGVSAGTLSAIDPINDDSITGNFYFNITFQLNSTNSNVSRIDFFLVDGTTFTLLGSNQTANVSLNDSGFATILIRNNTAGITDGDYDIHINATVDTPTANNDTLVITGVDIDNTNPTAAITSQYRSAILGGEYRADCGTSTDGVDTALTTNTSIWKPDGSHLTSVTNTNAATGAAGSSIATFLGASINDIPGIYNVNCRVTDNVGLAVTSSNITVLFQDSADEEGLVPKEETSQSKTEKSNMGMIAVTIIVVVFVFAMILIITQLVKRQKKQR